MHCLLLTGCSVTGVLYFINQIGFWRNKLPLRQQLIVPSCFLPQGRMCGMCVEQAIDLHNTLQYLGVLLTCCRSFMFGNDNSVVYSSSKLHAKLHKLHNALVFIAFEKQLPQNLSVPRSSQDSVIQPVDILSKHWSHAHIHDCPHLIIFWRGIPVISPNPNNFPVTVHDEVCHVLMQGNCVVWATFTQGCENLPQDLVCDLKFGSWNASLIFVPTFWGKLLNWEFEPHLNYSSV